MVEARELWKEYGEVAALRGVSLVIGTGEFVALVGPSGCGKTTLLHLLGGLDTPTSGEVRVGGESLAGLSDEALSRLRRTQIGVVFQFFNLLPTLTVRENVMLPALLAGRGEAAAGCAADALIAEVGLAGRAEHRTHQLSGGELQRAAIARALVNGPKLLLADEPTGNLDSENSARVLDVLARVAAAHATAVLLITHSAEVAARAGRVLRMRDGRIDDAAPPGPADPRAALA
jgi:putative ABC transport system ATP-binding protein